MSIENLSKRVKALENSLYDFTFPEGSTRFFIDGFTEKEKLLIGRGWQLYEEYKGNIPDDVLLANNDLLEAVERICWLRFLDIFKTIVCLSYSFTENVEFSMRKVCFPLLSKLLFPMPL